MDVPSCMPRAGARLPYPCPQDTPVRAHPEGQSLMCAACSVNSPMPAAGRDRCLAQSSGCSVPPRPQARHHRRRHRLLRAIFMIAKARRVLPRLHRQLWGVFGITQSVAPDQGPDKVGLSGAGEHPTMDSPTQWPLRPGSGSSSVAFLSRSGLGSIPAILACELGAYWGRAVTLILRGCSDTLPTGPSTPTLAASNAQRNRNCSSM